MFFLIKASYFWLVFASQIYFSYYGNCIASSQGSWEAMLTHACKAFEDQRRQGL